MSASLASSSSSTLLQPISVKYKIIYDDLPFRINGAIETFLGQLDALSTFGLFDASQLIQSLNGMNNWNSLNQNNGEHAYTRSPILLVTCTMDVNGKLWISPSPTTIAQLRYILLHVPRNILILIAIIPWDPLVTGNAIWTRVNPIADTEDSKLSCDAQCEPWKLDSIQQQWLHILSRVLQFNSVQIQLMQSRTVFLCIPTLILKHKWTGGDDISSAANLAHQRRQRFVTDFVIQKTSNFKHCVSWLALDENHLVEDKHKINRPAHTDIPWSETQFINTLVLPLL